MKNTSRRSLVTPTQQPVNRATSLYKRFLILVVKILTPKVQESPKASQRAKAKAFYAAFNQTQPIEHIHVYGGHSPDPRFTFDNYVADMQKIAAKNRDGDEW